MPPQEAPPRLGPAAPAQVAPQLLNRDVPIAAWAANSVASAADRAAQVAESAAVGWRAEAESMRKVAAELKLLAERHL